MAGASRDYHSIGWKLEIGGRGRALLAEVLNQMPAAEFAAQMQRCCASSVWVRDMAKARPFADDDAVADVATRIWWRLAPPEWLAAFAAHPQIGDIANLRRRFSSTATWAGNEQAAVALANDATLERLAQGNRDYRQRFGYIFVVFATGKSAEHMLELLEARLKNDPEKELPIAAAEQLKITLLRLRKLAA